MINILTSYELLSIKNAIYLIYIFYCFCIERITFLNELMWMNWSVQSFQISILIWMNLYDALLRVNWCMILATFEILLRHAWKIIQKILNESVKRSFQSRIKSKSWFSSTTILCTKDVRMIVSEWNMWTIEIFIWITHEWCRTILIWLVSIVRILMSKSASLYRSLSTFTNMCTKKKIKQSWS